MGWGGGIDIVFSLHFHNNTTHTPLCGIFVAMKAFFILNTTQNQALHFTVYKVCSLFHFCESLFCNTDSHLLFSYWTLIIELTDQA